MSFNVRHGAGTDGALDLGRTAETIAGTGADVVGLQEVDRHFSPRSEFEDQTARLAAALGMHGVFGANLDRDPSGDRDTRRQYGNAILSRFPISSWSNTPLPRFPGTEQRGLLAATLDADGTPLTAFCTHLQNGPRRMRRVQVDEVVAVVASNDPPFVLMGDLNAKPGAPELRALGRHLVDSWAAAGNGAGLTHPARRPSRRIDYVFVSADVGVRSAAVVASDASDHLPVLAELSLPGTPRVAGVNHTADARGPAPGAR